MACDMWDPYIASITENAPDAKIVFDKFHVIKNYSQVIDDDDYFILKIKQSCSLPYDTS